MELAMLPVRSKANTTSPFGIIPGRNTVLCSVIDSPGRRVADTVLGVIDAEALDINRVVANKVITIMQDIVSF
jgi:hypothetical protein